MNHVIKLGLLSSLLSATLLADVKVVSSAKVISQMQTDIAFNLTDSETNKPLTSNVDFDKLDVDKGSKIGRMKVLSNGDYAFSITRKAGCPKSELKGVFSVTINGKKVQEPYTICKKDDSHFETAHPYNNNAKEEKILTAKDTGDFKSFEYMLTIKGETESNYDFVTITDLSGKTLKRLKLSGKIDKTVIFTPSELPEGKVKVLFTSDAIVTKEGVKVDLIKAPDSASIKVKSISDANAYESNYLSHEVTLTATPGSTVRLHFSLTDIETAGEDDYNVTPTFDNVNVTYDASTQEVVVGAGIDTFNMKIESIEDGQYDEDNETYRIGLDDISAIGTIVNQGE